MTTPDLDRTTLLKARRDKLTAKLASLIYSTGKGEQHCRWCNRMSYLFTDGSTSPLHTPDCLAHCLMDDLAELNVLLTLAPSEAPAEAFTAMMREDLEYWRTFLLRARQTAKGGTLAKVHIDHLTACATCIGNALVRERHTGKG